MRKKSRRENFTQNPNNSKGGMSAMYVAAIGAAGAVLGAASVLAYTERKMLTSQAHKLRDYATDGFSEMSKNGTLSHMYQQARTGAKRGRSRAKRILKSKNFKLKGKK